MTKPSRLVPSLVDLLYKNNELAPNKLVLNQVESNNNFPLQQGTPIKLTCPIKEKPKLWGKYVPGVPPEQFTLQNQVCELATQEDTQSRKQTS